MKKKILSLILALTTMLSLSHSFVSVSARSFIYDPNSVSGDLYTDNKLLADALTAVIHGDIDLFSNAGLTQEATMPIGSSLSSSGYYIKNKTTGSISLGWECYIYANAVYNRLFKESIQNGSGLINSEVVISGGKQSVSYTEFLSAGVRCGAYIRTTPNRNGSYTGSAGHSMIVLTYDQTHITYLEGNADGNGLTRITKETWSEFSVGELSGRSRYLCHVVQPTVEKYEEFYPTHVHAFTVRGQDESAHWMKCSVCEVIDKTTLATHIYDNACDTVCNICSATRTVPGHVYDNACDSVCNVCTALRTVPEHLYDNDEDTDCNICGAKKFTPGDVNDDGQITIDDAIYLLFHVNFEKDYPIHQPTDFDGNGKTELDDAIYLLFHVNFKDQYPLY